MEVARTKEHLGLLREPQNYSVPPCFDPANLEMFPRHLMQLEDW